jgi:phosphatidylglycerol:prolipoprotein diacylglycerol transferase
MVAAIVGGVWYLLDRVRDLHEDPDQLANVALWAILAGVVGARLVFVLANDPQWIWQDPLQALRIWQGGLAYDGAVGAGILVFWLQLRDRPLVSNHIADWTIPGIGLGIFMVRIGNIFNHEVLGRMTELGFGRWPEQLWGSFIGIFLIIRYVWIERNRPVPPGYQFWSAMFYYAVLRGVVGETTRDNPLYLVHYLNPHWGIGFTTLMQLFTPPILVFTGYMMWRTWRKSATRLVPEEATRAELHRIETETPRDVGRPLLMIAGVVSILGGLVFVVGPHIPAIGYYLIAAGIALGVSGLRWAVRYTAVTEAAPEGALPTGEVYSNPGGQGPVAVLYRGIRRFYVPAASTVPDVGHPERTTP